MKGEYHNIMRRARIYTAWRPGLQRWACNIWEAPRIRVYGTFRTFRRILGAGKKIDYCRSISVYANTISSLREFKSTQFPYHPTIPPVLSSKGSQFAVLLRSHLRFCSQTSQI